MKVTRLQILQGLSIVKQYKFTSWISDHLGQFKRPEICRRCLYTTFDSPVPRLTESVLRIIRWVLLCAHAGEQPKYVPTKYEFGTDKTCTTHRFGAALIWCRLSMGSETESTKIYIQKEKFPYRWVYFMLHDSRSKCTTFYWKGRVKSVDVLHRG